MFTLNIELGNEAMQTPEDIASALLNVVDLLRLGVTDRSILDLNGNIVGEFSLNSNSDED